MNSLSVNNLHGNLFRHLLSLLTLVMLLVGLPGAIGDEKQAAVEAETFFRRKVEPLLKSHCLGCHSHAANEMEGGLTLDSQSGWAVGGDRGPAILPGNPDQSLLIQAVRQNDPELQMPPDAKLTQAQIGVLVEWVRSGAHDPRTAQPLSDSDADPADWWSLRPLTRPVLPAPAADEHHERNVIDAFVRRQLESQRLTAVPQADRRTLIRRLYFDLHGLPPTPETVVSFTADPDPAAYAKLVDRLLDSPRYAERWARHWLDTVHFADTHGCEHDAFRPNAWRYRDYVIQSLDRDTPWPRFIREQLAADRFFPDHPELTVALGFIAAGPLELSRAGTAPVTFDYLDRDDMVTQTMAAFASTTANCARCHNHKFDPITQEDYYSLQAVFAGVGKGDVEYDDDPATAEARRQWNDLLTAAKAHDSSVLLSARYADVIAEWEQEVVRNSAVWEPLLPSEYSSSDGATLTLQSDNSVLASGVRPDKDTYTISAPTSLSRLSAIRLDVLADDSLPMKGPGRQDNGNLHLTEFEASLVSVEGESTPLKLVSATADWDQAGWTAAHALDGQLGTAWGIYPKVGQSHYVVFELEQSLELQEGSRLVIVLKQLHGGGHLIGRLKLYATDAAGAQATVLRENVLSAIKCPRKERSDEQQLAVAAWVLQRHAEQQIAELPPQPSVYAVSSSYSHAKKLASPMAPKTVHVLKRGDIQKPGAEAAPGALSAIAVLPGRFELTDPQDEASRRAALADWLAAPENPLTWRSIVNRVWAYHFGRGLCDTPNDFGRMGGTPTHPELLDWLAVWFRDDAQGSLKQLHRLIVLSSTYQRQSRYAVLPEANPVSDADGTPDADNRFLWRANRRRMDAESFRDAVLQISGRLDLTMGGPGVQQFTQSAGSQVTPKLHYDAFDWNSPVAARRSIYRVVWRGIADPFMESLDFPDLGILAPQRGFSVSALQALTLFNNDFVLHHSQVLADKLHAADVGLSEAIRQACRLTWLREPDQQELALLEEYANKHGLAAVCRLLFNSNEFLFVD